MAPKPFGASLATQGGPGMCSMPAMKSHKPSGVSLSPKGDLGADRQRELKAAFPRRIRGGKDTPSGLPYRKPQVTNDYGNGGAAL